MGYRIKSFLLVFLLFSISTIVFSVNEAFAGLIIGASDQGGPDTITPILVEPCPPNGSPIPIEGCAEVFGGVVYDPDAGKWIKEFDMIRPIIEQTGGTGLFPFGYVLHISETLVVEPIPGNPTGEWTDWHEASVNPDWMFIVDPALQTPIITTPSGVNAGVFQDTTNCILPGPIPDPHFFHCPDVWLDFDPPILSTDNPPQLQIEKYLECINPAGCQLIEPFLIVEEFPTSELDYGDDPDPFTGPAMYPTLLKSDGARHFLDADCTGATLCVLGNIIDSEPDGQPTIPADGDDLAGINDADGVTFSGSLTTGGAASADVTTATPGELLNAWIDLNQDGIFADGTAEQIATDAVLTGADSVPFSATSLGDNYLRFRYSTVSTTPTSFAPDGEVEDYLIKITERDGGPGGVPVGGTLIPIDSTSLILAGAQSTAAWMIPVIIAGIGIAIVIARKF